jgi:hypothetical protein
LSNTRLATVATARYLIVGRLLILSGRFETHYGSSRLLEELVQFLVQKLSL